MKHILPTIINICIYMCIIRHLAIAWCRLGKIMYDDSMKGSGEEGGSDMKNRAFALGSLLRGILGTIETSLRGSEAFTLTIAPLREGAADRSSGSSLSYYSKCLVN